MTVRRERVERKKGDILRWRIDISFRHSDGRVQRVARVAQIQTRRGAEQEERDIIESLQDGSWQSRKDEVPVPTFAEFEADYFTDHVIPRQKPSGVAGKKAIWKKHILPVFGSVALDMVTPRLLAKFVASRKRDYAPKTVNNFLTAIRHTVAMAAKWKIVPKSAIPEIEWLNVPEQDFDFLTYDEARSLVTAAAQELPWGPMIAVAVLTGMRLGELRALQWTAVDLDNQHVSIHRSAWMSEIGGTKGGKSRSNPLTATALAALQALPNGGPLVFAAANGALLTKEQCKWPLWRACKRAGLRQIGWHVLRHTFASHLAMRGAPLQSIQALLGHTEIRMTMRYAHLMPGVTKDAVSLLEEGLQEPVCEPATDASSHTSRTRLGDGNSSIRNN